MARTTWLTLTPSDVSLGVVGDSVVIQCHFDGNAIGLTENTGLAIRMLPSEARRIAEVLTRKADEAEASQRPN